VTTFLIPLSETSVAAIRESVTLSFREKPDNVNLNPGQIFFLAAAAAACTFRRGEVAF